jgi:hypothetical protein
MPYTATTRIGRRKLVTGRWIDADQMFAWVLNANRINTSVLNERREIHRTLRECYVNASPSMPRVGDTVLLIDTASSKWIETIQRLHAFLSDRTAAEHKPGSQRQTGADEVVRTDNNLSRAWSTAITQIIGKLNGDEDLVDRNAFEVGLAWTEINDN